MARSRFRASAPGSGQVRRLNLLWRKNSPHEAPVLAATTQQSAHIDRGTTQTHIAANTRRVLRHPGCR